MIREACARHGGVEVDTQGDAFFFAFPTAPAALAAAAELTRGARSRADPGADRPAHGHAAAGPTRDTSATTSIARRASPPPATAARCLSPATAELVELELTDLGEHRLKDISEPVAIFQLGSERFPPLKTISNTNLPRPASSFVGRDDELRGARAIEEGARLVTLTGPGGTGKTRLAIEAAATLVPTYKAGVFWVGLATAPRPHARHGDDRAEPRLPRTDWQSTLASASCSCCSTTSSR